MMFNNFSQEDVVDEGLGHDPIDSTTKEDINLRLEEVEFFVAKMRDIMEHSDVLPRNNFTAEIMALSDLSQHTLERLNKVI
jgi:hypothetical protein